MTTAHDDHLSTLRPLHNGPPPRGSRLPPTFRVHPPLSAAGRDGYVGKPHCEGCGTDEFIYLESYVPPLVGQDGSVKALGEASYTCTRCEEFSGHKVPFTWAPAGWFLG